MLPIFVKVAKLGGELSEKEADLMIRMADADGSGDINFSEFRFSFIAIIPEMHSRSRRIKY